MPRKRETVSAHNNNEVIFAEEKPEKSPKGQLNPWKIMIVDDEEAVHIITQHVLEDVSFDNRGFTYLNAYSGKQAIQFMKEHPDIALILLDVVMETDHAGLDAVRYIREELHNTFVRIILRTGQPGQAPERNVITEYDINDYKLKTMLTDQALYTSVITAIRSYRDLKFIEQQHQELERAMEEAQAANKAKLQFLTNMGHEFRTPLNAILGFADLLLPLDLTDKQRNYLEKIKKAGDGLCAVLNNILELTEIEGGQLVLYEAPFSLRDTIAEIMRIVEIQAEWKKLHTFYQIEDHVPDVLIGDSKRLKQVLMNLCVNALKHTESGQIGLNISRFKDQPTQILFSITDTGVGIAEDKLEHIFKPFALGEDPMTKRFAGAGLGLTISKNIIEKMNGRIWVDSTPGQGSTFYFSIAFKTM